MYTYPHTIDNGHGETLTFIKRSIINGQEVIEVSNQVSPGAGPPFHLHHQQDESLTVVKGKLATHIKGQPIQYHLPGETVVFKKGVMHRFWNAGDEILHCTGWISPPGNIEYFLEKVYESSRINNGWPGTFDAVYLLKRYSHEFKMDLPPFVEKAMFPLFYMIGKYTGKFRKFTKT